MHFDSGKKMPIILMKESRPLLAREMLNIIERCTYVRRSLKLIIDGRVVWPALLFTLYSFPIAREIDRKKEIVINKLKDLLYT
jgi:hypothetical protein